MSYRYIEKCPHCGANLVGTEIPESHRSMFGNVTHFSLLIGISNGDSIMYYECPECRKRVERKAAEQQFFGGFRVCGVEVRG